MAVLFEQFPAFRISLGKLHDSSRANHIRTVGYHGLSHLLESAGHAIQTAICGAVSHFSDETVFPIKDCGFRFPPKEVLGCVEIDTSVELPHELTVQT